MADPNPYFAYLRRASDNLGKSESVAEPILEPSSFLLATYTRMTTGQVRDRFLPILADSDSGSTILDSIRIETMSSDEEGAEDIDFIVDIGADQFSSVTEHARTAIEFAEWLVETQDWIAQAEADIVWDGTSHDGAAAFAKTSSAFCSAGEPGKDHDWLWGYKRIRAGEALVITQNGSGRPGGSGILIGHIDTGFSRHNETDNTYDTGRSYDLILKHPPGSDPMNYTGTPGHGGSTASVMVSRSNYRINGIAPEALTVPFRAIKHVAVITKMGRVAKAIRRATDGGCQVISMSLGGLSLFSGLEKALNYALEKNVIIIAAAGNCIGLTVAPAINEDCIAVSGIGPTDSPWKHASHDDLGRVDIAGPAQWVLAAAPKTGPSEYSPRGEGTSYATAMTAGAAALWLAHHGRDHCIDAARNAGVSLQKYFQLLLRKTACVPNEWNRSYGAGILDCEALLNAGLPSDLSKGEAEAALAKSAGIVDPAAMTTANRFELALRSYQAT